MFRRSRFFPPRPFVPFTSYLGNSSPEPERTQPSSRRFTRCGAVPSAGPAPPSISRPLFYSSHNTCDPRLTRPAEETWESLGGFGRSCRLHSVSEAPWSRINQWLCLKPHPKVRVFLGNFISSRCANTSLTQTASRSRPHLRSMPYLVAALSRRSSAPVPRNANMLLDRSDRQARRRPF